MAVPFKALIAVLLFTVSGLTSLVILPVLRPRLPRTGKHSKRFPRDFQRLFPCRLELRVFLFSIGIRSGNYSPFSLLRIHTGMAFPAG